MGRREEGKNEGRKGRGQEQIQGLLGGGPIANGSLVSDAGLLLSVRPPAPCRHHFLCLSSFCGLVPPPRSLAPHVPVLPSFPPSFALLFSSKTVLISFFQIHPHIVTCSIPLTPIRLSRSRPSRKKTPSCLPSLHFFFFLSPSLTPFRRLVS